jgi:hypothetical protein
LENRVVNKAQSANGGKSRDNNLQSTDSYAQSGYQYTLADVPKLAEQATNMYAQNAAERESYMKYYSEYYTNQINAVSRKLMQK